MKMVYCHTCQKQTGHRRNWLGSSYCVICHSINHDGMRTAVIAAILFVATILWLLNHYWR